MESIYGLFIREGIRTIWTYPFILSFHTSMLFFSVCEQLSREQPGEQNELRLWQTGICVLPIANQLFIVGLNYWNHPICIIINPALACFSRVSLACSPSCGVERQVPGDLMRKAIDRATPRKRNTFAMCPAAESRSTTATTSIGTWKWSTMATLVGAVISHLPRVI